MLQEKLNFLLEKYSVPGKGILCADKCVLNKNGKEIPLLPWRCERRFAELKKLANNGTLEGISVIRVLHIDTEDKTLEPLILRELDLCEYILGSKVIKTVAFFSEDKAVNLVATMENSVVCTIEISLSLKKGSEMIDKHEIIAQRGVVCDRVVDTQVPQKSIYLFGKENKSYLDVDFELYGLDVEQISMVRQAFEAMKNEELCGRLSEDFVHLKNLTELVKKGAF